MNLIDKDKLIDMLDIIFCHDCDSCGGDKCKWCEANTVIQYIKDFPTVGEAKPVTNCPTCGSMYETTKGHKCYENN